MTREEAKDYLSILGGTGGITENEAMALEMAIEALEQESILDKIKAEIEEIHLIGYATVDGKREIAKRAVMQILDKYKAESEE